MTGTVSAIVLAAGAGRRYGGRKLLAPIDGQPMIRMTVDRVIASAADEVIVVLGSDAADVREALAGLTVRYVINEQWRSGQGASIAAGVSAAGEAAAIIVVLGDQPGSDTALIDDLIATYRRTGSPIVMPEFEGEPRPPVLFDRSMFPALTGLDTDRGARHIVDRHRSRITVIAVSGPAPPDIDTVEDYEAFLNGRGEGASR